MTDTDVLIVGAAPTGLTLARELRLAGVRALVLERLEQPWAVPKAGGLGGQILDVLCYRGLIDRFEAASGKPRPTPRFPFGGLHVDLSDIDDNPMQALLLPQPQLEGLLADLAIEVGADIRRGHEVVDLSQDDTAVTATVCGPAGPYRVTAQYLVGCDGVGSRVRDLAGIAFPGITYPDVHRLGSFTMPASVTLRDDGDYEIAGLGRVRAGYTQTERGIFAISSYTPADLGLYTCIEEPDTYSAAEMSAAEFGDSIRRVLGADVPLGEPRRLTRFTYGARQVERYRTGRILVAGDAAHQFPSGGVAVNAGMLDAVNLGWKLAAEITGRAPEGLLDSYHAERHLAGERTLLHTQAQVALRRGLDPAAEALRTVFTELLTETPPRRRIGELIAGTDIRYPMPGARSHPLAGTFVRDVPGLTLAADPVLVDFVNRTDLRDAAREWLPHMAIHPVVRDDRAADALLVRPDGHVAWAAAVDEPTRTAAPALREAMLHWFGAPR